MKHTCLMLVSCVVCVWLAEKQMGPKLLIFSCQILFLVPVFTTMGGGGATLELLI